MKMKTMILLAALFAVGCGSAGSGSGDGSGDAGFSTQFVGTDPTATSLNQNQNYARALQASKPLKGLYFGELEVVAYNYNPGGATQAHITEGGFTGADWSYWVILQSGTADGRNNVLAPGKHLDISGMNGKRKGTPDEKFAKTVGKFQIDFLEVMASNTGVIYNSTYFGVDAQNNGTLYKYPEFKNASEVDTTPVFPGLSRPDQAAITTVNIIFARNDWFPNPVSIIMNGQTRGLIDSTSIALTADQEAKITSLVVQGSSRRNYSNLVVIPFDQFNGPAEVSFVSLNVPNVGCADKTKAKCNLPVKVSALNAQININFDLSDIFTTPPSAGVAPVFKGDANNVPFGLSVGLAIPTKASSK